MKKLCFLFIFMIIIFSVKFAVAVGYVETYDLTPPEWEGGRTELEFADIDQDGNLDILSIGDHGSPFIGTDQHGIMVWFGNSSCAWSVQMSGNFGYGGIAVGDVNNDGNYDVGYGMHHDYSNGDFGDQLIEVALGDGSGTNWTPWDDGLATNGESWGMFGTDFGDVNNDGLLDLVSNSFGADAGVHVYINQGDGSWQQSFGFVGGNSTNDVVFGDINNDYNLDFAVAHQYGTAYFGDGDGNFTQNDTGLPSGGAMGLSGVALGDVDNDGGKDLAFTNSNGGVEVWTWDTAEETWVDFSGSLPASGEFEIAQLYDMDVDGFVDVCAFGGGLFKLWLGDGQGNWTPETQFNTPNPGNAQAFRVGGDVDHSGYPDIALVAEEGGFTNSQNQMRFFREWYTPFELDISPIYPTGHEKFWQGSVRFIHWITAVPGDENSLINLELTTNAGADWVTLADSLPDNGTYQWTVPANIWSDYCKIRYTVFSEVDTAVAVTPSYFSIHGTNVGIADGNSAKLPGRFHLQNYPNPFNPTTEIRFDLPKASHVRLSIYDIDGKLVNRLMDADLTAGHHSKIWDGTDDRGNHLPSGIYFYELITENRNEIKKAILIK